MTLDTITLIANVALTLSFIVALMFGIAQVRAAARDRRERLTLEALRSFQTREYCELIQYIISHKMPADRTELEGMALGEQVLLIQVAQSMEMLGILVAERYVNYDLVDKTIGSFVTTAWEKLRTFTLNARPGDPFLNEYFQWLAEGMSLRMSERPRRPFHEMKVPLS